MVSVGLTKHAIGDFELLLQEGYQLHPQLEAFKGEDFISPVGDMHILCRYAKGKE